ncbi:hypothetical protein C5E41_29525 [Nocardia nova]|nr:hypothetical protein C5E41_29525 [Nocardia nova]
MFTGPRWPDSASAIERVCSPSPAMVSGSPASLLDEGWDHPAVVGTHARPVGIEDAGDRHIGPAVAVIGGHQGLGVQTLRAGADGTAAALDLADRRGARLLLASSSEVYGDPAEHPQRETYWGNVNPVGPRSVYDEAKRYADGSAPACRPGAPALPPPG